MTDHEAVMPFLEAWERAMAEQEQAFQQWCVENGEDPETGTAARRYEEEVWMGMPTEEFWVFQQEEQQAEQRHTSRDGGAVL